MKLHAPASVAVIALLGSSCGTTGSGQTKAAASNPITPDIRTIINENVLGQVVAKYPRAGDGDLHVLGVGTEYLGSLALLGAAPNPLNALSKLEVDAKGPPSAKDREQPKELAELD